MDVGMNDSVSIEHDGLTLTHRGPGPFRVETKKYCSVILNSHGINWISGMGGQTLFAEDDEAKDVCDKFNAALKDSR